MQKGKCFFKEYLLSKVHEFAIVHSIEMNVLWIKMIFKDKRDLITGQGRMYNDFKITGFKGQCKSVVADIAQKQDCSKRQILASKRIKS